MNKEQTNNSQTRGAEGTLLTTFLAAAVLVIAVDKNPHLMPLPTEWINAAMPSVRKVQQDVVCAAVAVGLAPTRKCELAIK